MYGPITPQINYLIFPWINHPNNQPNMSKSITVDLTTKKKIWHCSVLLPIQKINTFFFGGGYCRCCIWSSCLQDGPGQIFIITCTPLFHCGLFVTFSVWWDRAFNHLSQAEVVFVWRHFVFLHSPGSFVENTDQREKNAHLPCWLQPATYLLWHLANM